MNESATRRDFIGRSTIAATGLASAVAASAKTPKSGQGVTAKSASRIPGANDRIGVGIIGLGSIGSAHLRTMMPQAEETKDIQVVGVCDLYSKRREMGRTVGRLTDQQVHLEYHEMLARADVDTVVIAVPDHSHARVALDAIAAGKDVYLQKPMTYTFEEAHKIALAAKSSGRIVEVGVQGTSEPRYKIAKDLIAAGEIGAVIGAQGNSSRNSMQWRVELAHGAGRARPKRSTGSGGWVRRPSAHSAPNGSSAGASIGIIRAASPPICSSTAWARW